ncbi:hypothetical protein E2493_13440 [Sphingomonas parva]|uniref:DUF1570 domain-containing protein n=1 Tax=Sphingomonas parva TaxID=2555898 RepID=A0A4Y8ZR22_9SPHN|nr:hypothetical protein [Sphingomonas parva]TFI57732.1 hypothetical protein E2493_13440 [Sphingomonas parva]
MIKKTLLAFALAASALSPASAAWRQATSKHFLIYSDQSEADLRALADRLERYDSAMRVDRGVQDPDKGQAGRVRLFVVEDIDEVQKIFGDNSTKVAGFYIPRAGGSFALMPRRIVASTEREMDAEHVLRHEYAHAFMFENWASLALPRWLGEGFAEFSAGARVNKDGSVDFGMPARHRIYGLAYHQGFTLNDLLEPPSKMSPEDGDAFYGKSWLLTHMLTFDKDREGQLGKYLSELNSGKSGMDAAKAAFGDLKKLDVDMRAYLKQSRFQGKTIPAGLVKPGSIEVRPLTAAEAAIIPIVIRSKRGVTEESAKKLVLDARKAAAPFPNDKAAQVMLAEAEFDAKNYAEAEAAADRAIAADPQFVDAILYKGMARMEKAKAEKSSDPTVWREVRRLFSSANRADPSNPLPLVLFYDSFEAAGAKPTDNAVAGLFAAFEAAPQDIDVRLKAGRQYLASGNAAGAKLALGPVAYHPHGGELAEMASAILKTLADKGAPAALSEFDRLKKEAEDKEKEAAKKKA